MFAVPPAPTFTEGAGQRFRRLRFAGLIKPGMEVSVWGPWGRFVLERESTRPLVFVAIDDGFAPINSLIEHAIAVDAAESITLYWAATRPGGQYLPNQCRAWASALDEFHYRPIDLDALGCAGGRCGRKAGSDVYLAGPGRHGRSRRHGAAARRACRRRNCTSEPCSAMTDATPHIPILPQAADPALEACAAAEPFALMVLGDSMEPEFREGEVILIEPEGLATDGSFVLAQLDGEWIFRQLVKQGEAWQLRALNPAYPAADIVDLAAVKGVVIQKSQPGRRKASKRYVE
jgi:DNA polymerase V